MILDLERVVEDILSSEKTRPEGKGWGLVMGVPRWNPESLTTNLIQDLHEIPDLSNQISAIRLFLVRFDPVLVTHVVRRPGRVWVYCADRTNRMGFFGRILSSQIQWRPLKESEIPTYFPPCKWVS